MMQQRFTFLILLSFIAGSILAQSYSSQERKQGYTLKENRVTFIFDPGIYGVQPDRVLVTGSFRNWDQNMNIAEWTLKKESSVWTLSFDNTDYEILRPNDPFKFRINDGEWLAPPTETDNERGGNLIFMMDQEMNDIKAELVDNHTVWANITGDRPLRKSDYRLTNAAGDVIEINKVLPNTSSETLIKTKEELDIRRVYYLEIPSHDLKTVCSFDGWFRTLYSSKELGATTLGTNTNIRIFAPRAEKVKVYLYKGRFDNIPFREVEMKKDGQGVWEAQFQEDLHGTYYDFTIHGPNDPGNNFYETNPVHITDPYARVSDNTWGKARVWNKTVPAAPLKDGIPKMKDVIAYEVHVQDFTDLLPVAENIRGTFRAMVTPGLKNSRGEKIGFDYLVDLGINTVHLMPVQEYLHFPDEDWKASFENDEYMIEQGVNEENYQWGYRTSHAFAVESKYRSKDKEPGEERDEFRDLVQAFHDKGLAVIIDIVPNHTAENMDGNELYFNFNAIDKQYYYRTKDLEHIGEYGNEIKTENRPMVQRWLIDQCQHYINEFGIDGFRIDLAGQIDQQTLIALREVIGTDKILYGEAWIGSNDPEFEANPDWDWYKEDAPITFFQDDARNAFKGPVFELKDKYKDRGWPGGKFDERENVKKGLSNRFPEDKSPISGINYLDIHDNFALADQFASKNFDGRKAVDQDLYKIAVTLLYTSLGPIVTHGGSEIMRSKAGAPLKEVEKETKQGFKIYMHGKRDTYNHRMANRFIWENVGSIPKDSNQNDYKNMHAFWKGMNAFRLSNYGSVFRQSESVRKGYYKWLSPKENHVLGYIVDEKILVLLNAGGDPYEFTGIQLPAGNWKLVANNKEVDHKKGVKDKKGYQKLIGEREHHLIMEPESLRIWVKE